jgi:hypothetical protein
LTFIVDKFCGLAGIYFYFYEIINSIKNKIADVILKIQSTSDTGPVE